MKKRKIFIGLALASACVFSLAACGKKAEESTTAPTVVDTSKTPAASSTAQNAQSSSVVTSTPTPTQQGEGEQQGGEQVVNKYSLSFNANGHGESPDDIENLTAFPAELPTIKTEDGYVLIGWAKDENATEPNVVAGDPLQADTELFAVWGEENTEYGRLARSEGNVIATKFLSGFVGDYNRDEKSWKIGDVGFYNANKYDKNGALVEGVNVSIADGKLVLTDDSSTETTTANAEIGFLYDGVVEGSLKYTPTNKDGNTNGGWSWVQFCGYTGFDDAASTLFAIRTNSSKKAQVYFTSECGVDSDNKTTYDYKGNEFTYEAGKEYEVYWKYDFENAKLTIKIDNTVIVENYDVPQADQPVFLTSLKFITATDAKRGAKIGDFAVANTNVKSLENTKTYFKAILDDICNSMNVDTEYTFDKETIIDAYDETVAAINAATTRKDVFEAFISCKVADALSDAEYIELGKDSLNTYYDLIKDNYLVNADAVTTLKNTAITAIESATSKDDLQSAIQTFTTEVTQNVKSDSVIRGEALTEFTTHYTNKLQSVPSSDFVAAVAAAAPVQLKYVGDTDNPGLLATVEPLQIATTLAQGKQELDDVVAYYIMTLDQYKIQLSDSYIAFKTTALSSYDETTDPDLFTAINNLTIDFTGIETKEGAYAAFETAKDNVQPAIDGYFLTKAKNKAKVDLDNYVVAEKSKLLYQGSNYDIAINEIVGHQKDDIDALDDIDAIPAALEIAKAAVDDEIAAIKVETEITVTLKYVSNDTKAVLSTKTKVILKGNTFALETADKPVSFVASNDENHIYSGLFSNAYSNSDLTTEFTSQTVNDPFDVYLAYDIISENYTYVPEAGVKTSGIFTANPKSDGDLADGIYKVQSEDNGITFSLNTTGIINVKIDAHGGSSSGNAGIKLIVGSESYTSDEVAFNEAVSLDKEFLRTTSDNIAFKVTRSSGKTTQINKITITIQHSVAVRFVDWVDEYETIKMIKFNTIIDAPERTTKEVNSKTYTFLGWYIDDEYSELFDFTKPITKDLIIYSNWTDKEIQTVTFKDGDTVYSTIQVEKGSQISEPVSLIKTKCQFAGWYISEDGGKTFDGKYDFTSVVEDDLTLYASWYDLYESVPAISSEATFKGMSALPQDDADDKVTFGKKGVVTTYTVDGITYTASNTSSADFGIESDGLKMSKKNQSISFVAPANSIVTIYLRNGKSDGSRMFDVTSTGGLSLTNIGKNYSKPSSGADNVTVTNGVTLNNGTDQNAIKLEIEITTEQTITIEYSANSSAEGTVHVQQIAVYSDAKFTAIKSIAATVTAGTDSISISDVKLLDDPITPNVLKVLDTNEYTVEVEDSEGNIISNYSSGLSGRYTVTITYKYGNYTVLIEKLSVGIVKHTVSINGTAYEVEDGSTLASILPASATRADDKTFTYTIKYEFDKWINEVTLDEVTAETVVTGNLIVSPSFIEKYYVSSEDDFKTIVNKSGELYAGLIKIYLDSNIEITTQIQLFGNIEINTGEYTLTDSNKIIVYASASVVCDKDIEGFLSPYEIDEHEILKAGEGPYTYTVVAKSNS